MLSDKGQLDGHMECWMVIYNVCQYITIPQVWTDDLPIKRCRASNHVGTDLVAAIHLQIARGTCTPVYMHMCVACELKMADLYKGLLRYRIN
jgi:hypothetical protein